MDKKFLNKIVNQIMRETEMVYPTSDELGYVNFPFSRIYGSHDSLIKKNWTILETLGFFSALPSSPFKQHLEEIYSLNSWGDPYNEQLNYLWDKYTEVFIDKLKRGINIVDTPDNDIPQRWVGQLDESFKKGNTISFLIKVVDQLINETEIVNVGGQRVSRSPWSNVSHLGSAFWDRLRRHCRSVYGLNTDELLWVEDYYRERLDSKLRNNLSESKVFEVKDNKFLQKVLKYLIDNTKVGRYEKLPDIDFHYDGYIIVPIGNGFRFDVYNETRQANGDFTVEWWGEMKDVYSLKNEEVIPLLDEYNDYLWELVNKISSKEDINESYKKRSWQNDSFINKVSDDIMRETKKSNEFPHLFMFPFINKPIVVQNIRNISFYVSYFVDHCVQVYGIDWDSEIDSVWYKYIDKFKEKYKIVDSINESKVSDNKFLNKLLDHIKSETKFKKRSKFMHSSERTIYAGNYVRLPFFPEDWYRGLHDLYITDFIRWIHTTLGINDPTEIEYLWKRYLEWVNKKCNE